jgi:two-component system copper resistance phosphate regulon response regulator CusR
VERDGRVIGLTPREFTLLEYMMQHEGKTLSRALLTQEVWNMPAEGNTNIVDVYVKYLRDKLDGDYDIKMIRTIRGLGYVYQPQA